MKYFLIFILTFSIGLISGQIVSENFFSDSTYGDLDQILDYIEVDDGILISGIKNNPNSNTPCVVKLNTNGEVVWTTLSTTIYNYTDCRFFNIELFNDGYIYGASKNYLTYSNQPARLWKINASTGEIKWVTSFYTSKNYILDIVNYDSTTYLLAYSNNNNEASIGVIDKSTGDTIQTKSFELSQFDINLAVDNNKNVYFSVNNYLRKFNSNDFEQTIWENTYLNGANTMDAIHEMYLDRYDELYLFGRNGGTFSHGQGIGIKVNINTGEEIWNEMISNGDVQISDFKDDGNKLYVCHHTTVTGSGTFKFRSAKLDKQTGNVDWITAYDVTPMSSPNSNSGGEQAAMGLDIDCDGNVYLTGYYGDINIGPSAWGIIKLNGSDGSKLYDLYINDTTSYYNYKTGGLGVCVFGNSPTFLGHLDDGISSYYPLFVKIESSTGNILEERRIGGGFQQYSRTLDIKNYSNKTYILKQKGKDVILEQYNTGLTIDWTKTINTSGFLFADQFNITPNNIFLTAHRIDSSASIPFYQNQTASIQLYKLNRTNGNILDNDSIPFNQTGVKVIELESDDNAAFVFYSENNNINYVKWSSSIVSNPQFLETVGANASFEGSLNIVDNANTSSLYALGTSQLYNIDKSSLSKSPLFTYSARTIYDHLLSGDTLLTCGNNSSNQQLVSAFNINTGSLFWEHTNNLNGQYTQIKSDHAGNIYTSGTVNNNINVSKISQDNGSNIWSEYLDTVSSINSSAYDLLVNQNRSYVAVSGTTKSLDSSSNAIIYFLGLQGIKYDSIIKKDELGGLSVAACMENLSNFTILVGGSINQALNSKQGFIYNIDFNGCANLTSIITNYFTNLTALPGMDQYQWLDCNNGNLPIAGETSQTFAVQSNGSYAVQIVSGTCTSVSNCFTINNVAVENNDLSEISFYPNPTHSSLYFKGLNETYTYKIFNSMGKLVTSNTTSNREIDVAHLSNGIYYIRVTQGANSTIFKFSKF